ncbi:hypothetical protein BH20ACT8_BH20ACT8_00290 [soil metagenome]
MREQPLRTEDPAALGRWVLKGRLGSGGMGTVYWAQGPDGRRVAVKLLHTWLTSDDNAVARFRREATLLAKIDGPCVARVLDVGSSGSQPYLVCEYVDGPTIAQHVEGDGPLPPELLVPLAAGLASALQTIHAAGVVHRDLTASNVLLAPDGPRVVDFGIARHGNSTAITASRTIVGTPLWMAPEQIRGGPITPAIDIFAWGALVAFAASGRPPFGGETTDAVLYRIVHEPPDLPALNPPLDGLVAAALAKDPADRPPATELAARLQMLLGDADVTRSLQRTWTLTPADVPTTPMGWKPTATEQPIPEQSRLRGLITGATVLLLAGLAAANASSLPPVAEPEQGPQPEAAAITPAGATASTGEPAQVRAGDSVPDEASAEPDEASAEPDEVPEEATSDPALNPVALCDADQELSGALREEGIELPDRFLRIGANATVVYETLLDCFGEPTSDSGWQTSTFEAGLFSCQDADFERSVGWDDDEGSLWAHFVEGGRLAGTDPLFVAYEATGAGPSGKVLTTDRGMRADADEAELTRLYPDAESGEQDWATFYRIGPSPVLSLAGPVAGLTAIVPEGEEHIHALFMGPFCGE